MPRIRRLPIIPLAEPVQLVLGLDRVGIRAPRRRRKMLWVPAPRPTERAA